MIFFLIFRASQSGFEDIIKYLLEHNADPSIKGIDTKYAYDLAKNKSTRSIFRKFAAQNPNKFNWQSIGVNIYF